MTSRAEKLKLECTHDQFHAVHLAADSARSNAVLVRVNRQALLALLRSKIPLRDHSKLVTLHRESLGGIL